jgi:hypothetical protein
MVQLFSSVPLSQSNANTQNAQILRDVYPILDEVLLRRFGWWIVLDEGGIRKGVLWRAYPLLGNDSVKHIPAKRTHATEGRALLGNGRVNTPP